MFVFCTGTVPYNVSCVGRVPCIAFFLRRENEWACFKTFVLTLVSISCLLLRSELWLNGFISFFIGINWSYSNKWNISVTQCIYLASLWIHRDEVGEERLLKLILFCKTLPSVYFSTRTAQRDYQFLLITQKLKSSMLF